MAVWMILGVWTVVGYWKTVVEDWTTRAQAIIPLNWTCRPYKGVKAVFSRYRSL